MSARVSVVIPAYNPGPYLTEAVNSVVSQDFADWELLIVDDGSTQPLPDLPSDPRIRVFHQENGGVSSARNLGIDHACGEFVALLDHDDLWMPTKIERQVAAMDTDPRLHLCATQFQVIDSGGSVIRPGYGRPMSRLDLLATGDGICASSVMFRVGPERFREDLDICEDFDMWLRLSGDRPEGYVPSVEVSYRLHGANTTGDYLGTWHSVRKVYDLHPHPAGASGLASYRKVFACQAWDAARSGCRLDVPRHVLRGWLISPTTMTRLVAKLFTQRLRA